MNRKLRAILIVGCLALVGLTTLVSLSTSAASLATHTFVPIVQRDAAAVALPDLIPTYVYWNMRGYHSGCVREYGPLVISVCIRNAGSRAAGPFALTVYGAEAGRVEGLAAGAQLCQETDALYLSNPVTVVVDPANQVAESDETNNTWSGILPVPTAPPLCTATPTPSPTASTTATATPSPTACPSGIGPDGINGCPIRATP